MIKNKLWISVGLVALIVLTGLLKSAWEGFINFSLAFLVVLCLYWAFIFIYQYLEDYKWNFQEDFALYRAQTINSTSLTEKDFDMAHDIYVQKFKKLQVRDKMIDMFKIIFCIAMAITCIVAMCSGIIK